MGIQAAELAAQRRVTAAFIAADSVAITLLRAARTPDGAGGYEEGSPAPLVPQIMRLIPQGSTGADSKERQTADGQMVSPQYVLLGQYNADMERWDAFEMDGRRYEILFVNQNRQYETKGEVFYRGE